MHHGAACEIQARNPAAQKSVEQSALAPHHVGHRKIHEQAPQHREQEHGAELHALGKGSADQRGGDDGEHQLVDHEGLLRDGGRVIGIGRAAHVVQERVVQISEDRRGPAKDQAVADQGPDHSDHGHENEALHHGA